MQLSDFCIKKKNPKYFLFETCVIYVEFSSPCLKNPNTENSLIPFISFSYRCLKPGRVILCPTCIL